MSNRVEQTNPARQMVVSLVLPGIVAPMHVIGVRAYEIEDVSERKPTQPRSFCGRIWTEDDEVVHVTNAVAVLVVERPRPKGGDSDEDLEGIDLTDVECEGVH